MAPTSVLQAALQLLLVMLTSGGAAVGNAQTKATPALGTLTLSMVTVSAFEFMFTTTRKRSVLPVMPPWLTVSKSVTPLLLPLL